MCLFVISHVPVLFNRSYGLFIRSCARYPIPPLVPVVPNSLEDRRDLHSAAPFGPPSFQNLGFRARAIERVCAYIVCSVYVCVCACASGEAAGVAVGPTGREG